MQLFVALKKNRDYIRAYKRGKSVVTPCLALYFVKNRLPYNRFGITTSKKIGGAVQRNRSKRIMRAAIVLLNPNLVTGYDFILVARGKTPYLKTQDIYKDFRKIAKDNNLLAGTVQE